MIQVRIKGQYVNFPAYSEAIRKGSYIGGLFLTAHGTSHQVERLFLVAGRSPRRLVVRLQALLNMPQDPGH